MNETKCKCGYCGERFQPRNFKRHVKACLRKRREERAKQAKIFLARFNRIGRGENV